MNDIKTLHPDVPVRPSVFKKYGSMKIAVGFVLLVAGAYFGYQFFAARAIDSKRFAEIEPGKVTLVGINAGSGYKIIVSNEIAQLVQGSDKFGAGDMSSDASGGDSSDKRRIPLKETLLSLQGDEKALDELVTVMNDDLRKSRQEIPPDPVIWKADDLDKAIKGDHVLQTKLEHDLNAKLDGTPADFINVNALYNGITIELPVPVKVSIASVPKTLTAHVRIPYRVGFTRAVEKALQEKGGLSPSNEQIKGYYLETVAALMKKKGNQEDVAASLSSRISEQVKQQYADAAERVLGNAKIVLNEAYIRNASIEQNGTQQGKPLFDLVLNLTPEGRERLWQYSRHMVGTQLLLIVDGVAIAAPRVRHELAQSQVTITQMSDKTIVEDAVNTINASGKNASK